MIFANMHNHSTFSDGVYSPEELIRLGKSLGHGAVILSDHDTVRGDLFYAESGEEGIYTFLGCEFSTVGLGTSFHLLGFDFNTDWPAMRKLLDYCAKKQTSRSKLLFDWAVEDGTLKDITWEEVQNAFPYNDYFCNDQVFKTMQAKGIAGEYKDEAFQKAFSYLPHERQIRIEKITGMHDPDVEDVIRIVREAGGVPVLAHPHGRLAYVEPLLAKGLMGLEVNFPEATEEESAELNRIADEKGLYKTGGTDHSYVLGGQDPQSSYFQCPHPEKQGVSEEDFMKLYRRALG